MQRSVSELFAKYRDLVLLEAELKQDLESVQQQMEEIQDMIDAFGSNNSGSGVAYSATYRDGWKIIQKAIHIIRTTGKCMPVREIVEKVKELEGKIDDQEFDRQLMSTMSSTLSTNAKKGKRISRYQPYEGDDWFYGLIDWFKEDGTPQDEYRVY